MSRECTAELFLKDVAGHKLTVIREDGVYRHLQFRKPDTGSMGFNLITWPGYLCICGDMGEYVFQRLYDMFEFFRDDKRELRINRPYWAEKCQAADVRSKVKEFSPELFRSNVREMLESFCADRDDEADAGLLAQLTAEVESEVFIHLDDNEYGARDALRNMSHEGREVFPDFWERSCEEFTFHFTWICCAISWGVQQYDARPVPAPAAALPA